MEELRINLIDLCNKSELPLEAILFVIRDVYRDVNEAFQSYQKTQIANKEKPNKEEK